LTADNVLWVCAVLAETALVILLWKKHVLKTLPVFFIYLCWALATDVAGYSIQAFYPQSYPTFYWGQMVIDSILVFAVLVELAWSVLRPIRKSLPKRSWIGIALLIALAGLLVWPIAGFTVPGKLTSVGTYLFRLQQTFAILRVVVFLGMAAFSQVLSIGWRDRELQVATGLGFYSIVSLGVTVAHTHQLQGTQYHWLDEVVMASYLAALGYWVFSFTTKVVERQNFSPQMESFLLLVGGTAKTGRSALGNFVVTKNRPKDHQ
jgi:hypothetical protein